MRVLLTGKSSCIGGYVYNLLEKNDSVEELVCVSRKNPHYYGFYPIEQRTKFVDCHLDSFQHVKRLMSEFSPSVIIHLAGLGKQQESLQSHMQSNFTTTMNLLEYCPKDVRFIYLSTIVTQTHPHSNNYIISKQYTEDMLKYYDYHLGKIHRHVIRPCAIVGRSSTRGIVPDVVRKLRDDNNYITLMGRKPGTVKPYCYAGDLAKAIVEIVNTDKRDILKEINYGPSDSLNSMQVASIVMEKLGIRKSVFFNDDGWWGDQKAVYMPQNTTFTENNSQQAIELALEDMLK